MLGRLEVPRLYCYPTPQIILSNENARYFGEIMCYSMFPDYESNVTYLPSNLQ
jgi:hypothetical protein